LLLLRRLGPVALDRYGRKRHVGLLPRCRGRLIRGLLGGSWSSLIGRSLLRCGRGSGSLLDCGLFLAGRRFSLSLQYAAEIKQRCHAHDASFGLDGTLSFTQR
jgi:hypothetical protein